TFDSTPEVCRIQPQKGWRAGPVTPLQTFRLAGIFRSFKIGTCFRLEQRALQSLPSFLVTLAGFWPRRHRVQGPLAGEEVREGMTLHIVGPNRGFGPGFTAVVEPQPEDGEAGIAFGVLRLAAGERVADTVGRETAWLLMAGTARLAAGGREARLSRRALFDESPSCPHVAAGGGGRIRGRTGSGVTVYRHPKRRRSHC